MKKRLGKIALFCGGGVGYSQTNVSVYLVSGLALLGYKVDLVTLFTNKAELMAWYDSVEGFEKVNIYSLEVANAWRSLLPLTQYYRQYQPEIMFSQLTYFNAIAVIAKRLSGVQTANVLLEGTLLSKMIVSDFKFSLKLMLVPILAKLTYPLAQGFIAKSSDILIDTRQVVGKGFERLKTTVLPNPYPFERFKTLAKESVEHSWFVSERLPIIVSSGRLCEQKGFDTLLKAFALVKAELPCRLMILGEGPDRQKLEKLIRKLDLSDFVNLRGRVSNPWKYVARSDLFVLASRWEGWPSALMEAIALGIPVITTDCPGDGKKMIENEVNGIIVPTDDITTLSNSIIKILSHQKEWKLLTKQAEASIMQYDYSQISKKYIDFANSLLST